MGEQREGEEGGGRGQTAGGQLLIRTTPSSPCRTDWSSDKACQHTPITFQLPQSAAAQIFDYHLAASPTEVNLGNKALNTSDDGGTNQ